jgi:ribosome-associated protein
VEHEQQGADDEFEVAPGVRIRRSELKFTPLRAGGPGGQNVNKVSNGVELRWNLAASPALRPEQRELLREKLGKRVNSEGEFILRAVEFRERLANLESAQQRFVDLVSAALKQQPRRRATRPTRGSDRRRREAKSHRSAVKRERRSAADE